MKRHHGICTEIALSRLIGGQSLSFSGNHVLLMALELCFVCVLEFSLNDL